MSGTAPAMHVLANGVLNTMHVLRDDGEVIDPFGPYMGRETLIDKHIELIRKIHGL